MDESRYSVVAITAFAQGTEAMDSMVSWRNAVASAVAPSLPTAGIRRVFTFPGLGAFAKMQIQPCVSMLSPVPEKPLQPSAHPRFQPGLQGRIAQSLDGLRLRR